MMCYCFALVLLVQMQSTPNNFQLKKLDSYVKSWQRGKKPSKGEKKPRNTGAIERKKKQQQNQPTCFPIILCTATFLLTPISLVI